MSQPAPSLSECDAFEQEIQQTVPQLLVPVQHVLKHAPAPLNTPEYVRSVLLEQDCVVRLLEDLRDHIAPEDLAPSTTTNSTQCDVWSDFGLLLKLQGKPYQALEVFDALYTAMLSHQTEIGRRFHKGLPLFWMSDCYNNLGWIVHSKRYMMLTLYEDAITDGGTLNVRNTGSYGGLASRYAMSHDHIMRYVKQAYVEYQERPQEGTMPEWILQELDQDWNTTMPSSQEAGEYRITRAYCRFLLGRLGVGDGKDLERLAQYLVSAIPGCRTNRRKRTYSSDYDVIVSVEGPIADFRSELGRYFVCECKDRKRDKASFTDVAKFCRVLDSVKAKFGVMFSPAGHSGEGKARDADREILKVYQDRGIVIVVVNRNDLQQVAEGASFISMLRDKYEAVRLDLRPQ